MNWMDIVLSVEVEVIAQVVEFVYINESLK